LCLLPDPHSETISYLLLPDKELKYGRPKISKARSTGSSGLRGEFYFHSSFDEILSLQDLRNFLVKSYLTYVLSTWVS
jgi:hypothetical protein